MRIGRVKKPIARPADPLEETVENPDLPPIAAGAPPALRRRGARSSTPRLRLTIALCMVVVAVAALIRHVGA